MANLMNTEKKTLGELIKEEVYRKNIGITAFADSIYCQRNNVYNIFKRGDCIDVAQLKLISKVLGRNFFEEIARDPELIDLDSSEVKTGLKDRLAVSQFMEVMPDVLRDMGVTPTIVYSKFENMGVIDLPDFGLADIPLSFTIGKRLSEKTNGDEGALLQIEPYTSPDGEVVDVWINKLTRYAMIDIAIVFRSKDEWSRIMDFAINNVRPLYGCLCSYEATPFERQIAYDERKKL